jgi:hypothetical protein
MIEAAAFPWDAIAGGGAAVTLLGAFYVFLKHATEQRKESHDTIRKAHETIIVMGDKFSQTVGENTQTFSKTIAQTLEAANACNERILHEAREAHAKCEETIHGLLRDHRKP